MRVKQSLELGRSTVWRFWFLRCQVFAIYNIYIYIYLYAKVYLDFLLSCGGFGGDNPTPTDIKLGGSSCGPGVHELPWSLVNSVLLGQNAS